MRHLPDQDPAGGPFLKPPTKGELTKLGETPLEEGYRLACQTHTAGDVTIEIPPRSPMEIGKYNTLTIKRIDKGGVLLSDGADETFLPGPEVTPDLVEGQELEVFVYNSQKNETRATLMTPKAQLNEFAYLEVVDVTPIGAFLDWGIPKDLMVPFGTQKWPLKKGEKTIVYIAQDSKKTGIIGFTNLEPFLSRNFSDLKSGQQVKLLVWGITPLGAKVIVDNRYSGLVYSQDIDEPLMPGQELTGWIRRLRKDGKLDIGLWEKNIEKADSFKARLIELLEKNNGALPLTDKSDPQLLRKELNMSKRMFKMITGNLLKDGKVEIHETGITLTGVTPPTVTQYVQYAERARRQIPPGAEVSEGSPGAEVSSDRKTCGTAEKRKSSQGKGQTGRSLQPGGSGIRSEQPSRGREEGRPRKPGGRPRHGGGPHKAAPHDSRHGGRRGNRPPHEGR